MNILQKLQSFGAKFHEDFCLHSHENGKFVLSKDMLSHQDLRYVMKYSQIPSTLHVEYNSNKFDELLKYLISKDFSVFNLKCYYARHSKEDVVFINHNLEMTVDVSSRDEFLLDESNSSSDSQLSTFSICYNASRNNGSSDIAFDMKSIFMSEDHVNNRGKVLLFEKDEYDSIVLTPHHIKSYNLDISENYNDDFQNVNEQIINWMSDFSAKNNKLVLLHGVPGAGKTNYIKHLLNTDNGVRKIYIPPYFVKSIADPGFLPVIKKEKESLLIIEDAEKILINRDESADNSIISILLNLCDGIMADVLNFKIIATFNTDEDRIDPALKRRGRMFLKYKFDALSEEKTRHLYKKFYNENPPKKRMTLADIYNTDNVFGEKKEERKMGFSSGLCGV